MVPKEKFELVSWKSYNPQSTSLQPAPLLVFQCCLLDDMQNPKAKRLIKLEIEHHVVLQATSTICKLLEHGVAALAFEI